MGTMQNASTGCARVGAVIVLAVAWHLSWGAVSLGAPAVVQLTAREWQYDPKEVTSSPGDLVFEVTNRGQIEHNFVIEDQARQKRAEIPDIEPGQTFRVAVHLRPGTYTIYCSLPGHREAGMIATLRLREIAALP